MQGLCKRHSFWIMKMKKKNFHFRGGCFLKWRYRQNIPKCSFLVGKPWLLGTSPLGNTLVAFPKSWKETFHQKGLKPSKFRSNSRIQSYPENRFVRQNAEIVSCFFWNDSTWGQDKNVRLYFENAWGLGVVFRWLTPSICRFRWSTPAELVQVLGGGWLNRQLWWM